MYVQERCRTVAYMLGDQVNHRLTVMTLARLPLVVQTCTLMELNAMHGNVLHEHAIDASMMIPN